MRAKSKSRKAAERREPSRQLDALELAEAGGLLGIKLVDSVVVSQSGGYFSYSKSFPAALEVAPESEIAA